MRLWLLGALAAVLAGGVALAGADPGREVKKADQRPARTKDKSRRPRPVKPCFGCFTPLSQDPDMLARARRQVEKQPQARPRPTRRPGYLTVLRPGKVEDPDVPARARRQVEKQPRARPRPTRRPGYLTVLRPGKAPPLDGRTRRDVGRRHRPGRRPRPQSTPTADSPNYPGVTIRLSALDNPSPEGPDLQYRARREAEGTHPKPPRFPCSGCYSPLVTHKGGSSAEGRPRARREDGQPLVAKRRAKQGGRHRLHCSGCFSSLTLQSYQPPVMEQESRSDGGASGN